MREHGKGWILDPFLLFIEIKGSNREVHSFEENTYKNSENFCRKE